MTRAWCLAARMSEGCASVLLILLLVLKLVLLVLLRLLMLLAYGAAAGAGAARASYTCRCAELCYLPLSLCQASGPMLTAAAQGLPHQSSTD
jgi:hypothetical protein